MSKLTPKDIIKLKKLDKDSKWEELKDIKVINDAIKDLDIYEERIQLGCSRYLSEDVVKSKNFDEDEMFRNCREAEKVKKRVDKKEKKKGGKASMGKAQASTDKKLLTTNEEEKKEKEEKDKKDKESNKITESIDKVSNRLYEIFGKREGNLDLIISDIQKDKTLLKSGMDSLVGVLMAFIAYFIPEKTGIYQFTESSLKFIGSIFVVMGGVSATYYKGKALIEWIVGKLREMWRWLKDKGYDFFGWGGGGGGDDGDDGSGGGGQGNVPQVNLDDEVVEESVNNLINAFSNGGGNDGGSGQGDSSNQQSQEQQSQQQQQPQQEVATQQFNYYQQQQNAQIRAMADKGRLETDTILRQSNPTQQKHTETKSNDGLISFKGQKYGKPPDTLDKFKETFNIEETKKIKPETKDWSDKEFYDFYKEWYKKQTTKDLGNVVDETPIKAPTASVLREEETSLDPMGNQLDSTEGHTTPSSYWESMANYGEKIHSGISSLNQMGMGLTIGAGLTALHYGTQLVRPALIRSQMEGASSDMSSQSLIRTESAGEQSDILHPFYSSGAIGEYVKSRGRPLGTTKQEAQLRLDRQREGRYVVASGV